jgi:ribonuclease T2
MKNRLMFLATLLVFALLGCNASQSVTPSYNAAQPAPRMQPRVSEAATANQPFNFYLLNLSWSPEFCHSHPNARECADHPGFVLHGLWPQNTTGPFPQHCTTAPGPRNPAAYRDIYPDTGLLRHEWTTHGTCSGLAPEDFFNLARKALQSVAIPQRLAALDHQISMPPAEIIDLFAQSNPSFPRSSFALSCGNNYLTAIEVCMTKSLQPTSCGALRSCGANTVRITPPQPN